MTADKVWSEVAAWLGGRAERTIETSCARVLLGPGRAWKIKRPVRLPFLDFSTLEKRKWALDRELAFNCRWAGDIYRGVLPVTRDGRAFALGGDGEVVEWLLEMRRFDPDAVLANRLSEVGGTLADTLGRLIARMHRDAPVALDGGGSEAFSYTIATNEDSLAAIGGRYGEATIMRLIEATRAGRDAVAPRLESRRRDGFGRQCHGDLHLGNILMEDDAPIPFDCIEFNDRLSRIDTLYDVAFPIMDLTVRGRGDAANRLLNAYLDETARAFPESLWDGLAALPVFLSVRAAVRGHVSAATGDEGPAKRYLAAAQALLRPPSPRLVAVGGLSGTGKSALARRMAQRDFDAPGAIVLRSDEIRKRLMGAAPLDRLPPEAYAPGEDVRVYDELFDIAARVLGAGWPVILDATFLDPETRAGAERVAMRGGFGFSGRWLEGEPDVLRARLSARSADASDADIAVLERQLARDMGPVTWPRLSIQSDRRG